MNPHPVELGRTEDGRLRIAWSDGQQRVYTAAELQENCPCASCREKRAAPPPAGLTILPVDEAAPLSIEAMQPVGSYAYSIQFSHGCTKGIYTFVFLRELGQPLDTQ